MSGTRSGGLKARKTNLEKYGKDFYREIGRKGGRNGHTGGFAVVDENGVHTLAKVAGAKGGSISRRGPAKRIKEPSAEKAQKPKVEEPKKARPEIKRSLWQRLWGDQDVKN